MAQKLYFWCAFSLYNIANMNMLKKKVFNVKTIMYWAGIIVVYYILFHGFYNMIATQELLPYKTKDEMLKDIFHNSIPIFTIFMLNIVLVFKVIKYDSTRLKIVTDTLLSFAIMLVVVYVHKFVHGQYRTVHLNWAGIVFNNIFILLGVEVVYYIKNFRESAKKAEKAQRQILQYKYDALKAQINPHFLFNSLNLLNSLANVDQEKMTHFIKSLSNMYRYVIIFQQKDKVQLYMELEFLKSYVSVLEMRYYNQFKVRIRGQEQIHKQEVIPYTLQLLIENVTKHNIISTQYPMEVEINIREKNIEVSNPICYREAVLKTHVGLHYLTSLYKQHNRDFQIINDGQKFTAIIPYI